MKNDPVKIVAAWIRDDDAAFDAEQEATLEIPAAAIERALAEAKAAREQEARRWGGCDAIPFRGGP